MFEPELIFGRWQDVGRDLRPTHIICDPPYGKRTHEQEASRSDGVDDYGLVPDYSYWNPADVDEFVDYWSPLVPGWMSCMTSHDLIPVWELAYKRQDRYCFAPISCVMRGMSCRMRGDGPSNWTVYLVVARPKTLEMASWGTLDGAYVGPRGTEAGGGRGKPDWLLQAIVRDYSRPGDTILDPFAGWGSTLAAARLLGRRSIGIDLDADAFAEAQRRVGRPSQIGMLL